MRTIGNNPQLSRQTQAVASGAITGGKPVVVNTNGTVSEITGATLALGSEAEFTSNVSYHDATFDSTNNRLIIAYGETSNGYARVCTVSDTSISLGSAVVFENADTRYISSTFDSNSDRVVISYSDYGNSNYLTAIVGAVDPSDNSISFGTAVVVQSGNVTHSSLVFDSSNNKIVLSFKNNYNSSIGTAVVGTVDPSDNSISFGTIVTFNNSNTEMFSAKTSVFDSNSNKVVMVYKDVDSSGHGKAIVGTVSGTDISFGTEVTFRNTAIGSYISAAFDSTNNKVLIAYAAASNVGSCAVGTVSGTSISFGTAVNVGGGVFGDGAANVKCVEYDSARQKVVVGWKDSTNSSKGTYSIGTVSGDTISFTGEALFNNGNTQDLNSTYDSTSERVVFVYKDAGDGDDGTAVALRLAIPTNITAENYIGIAEDTVATGQPVTVNTKGTVDENQTSLTAGQTYFVQTNGTLGTSADDPSVVAGTAVTATKLIVKG
jgi:hypothetical protein